MEQNHIIDDRRLLKEDKTKKPPTILQVERIVLDYYNVNVERIHEVTREEDIVKIRQIVCYFSWRYTTVSLPKIGKHFFNQDHTTVIHSRKKVLKSFEDTGVYRNEILEIDAKLQLLVESLNPSAIDTGIIEQILMLTPEQHTHLDLVNLAYIQQVGEEKTMSQLQKVNIPFGVVLVYHQEYSFAEFERCIVSVYFQRVFGVYVLKRIFPDSYHSVEMKDIMDLRYTAKTWANWYKQALEADQNG